MYLLIPISDPFSAKRAIQLLISFYLIIIISLSIEGTRSTYLKAVAAQDLDLATSTASSIATRQQQQQQDEATAAATRLANEALDLIRGWSSRFGRDVHFGTQEATCLRAIRDQFDPSASRNGRGSFEFRASVVSNDWPKLHDEIVKTISSTMGWHKNAVENIARASEELAGNHTFDKRLRFDYTDVHRLQNSDELYNHQETNLDQQEANGSQLNQQQPGAGSADDGSINSSDANHEVGQLDANGQLIGAGETEQPPEPLPKPSSLQQQQQEEKQQPQSDNEQQSGDSQSGEWQTPIKYLKLSRHKNFGDVLINTDESAVHIPVHIFPGEQQVMNGIAWSEELTKVFRDNFVRNPKLTNQYFASQYGFMRLFPAQKWQIARTDPDLYDARMRPWYVAGASSRKDVVILVDSSGSMTGSRRDIAKGVVFEILDTLTDNDHFMVLKFSDTVQQVGVPPCLKMRVERKGSSIPIKNRLFQPTISSDNMLDPLNSNNNDNNQNSLNGLENGTDIESFYLLPATGRNIRHLKANFTIPTAGIAKFSQALVTALEVLQNYRDSGGQLGAQCNQAIMLITDGSPSDFEEIFNRYNIPNAPYRVFTYLIGREAGDVTHTKMMACHNRGYYTHVINLAEVRETVQQYIPVMARPLVLNGSHPITWTPAYSELTYQILTDWIWESRRREKARAILAASGRGSPSNSISLSAGQVTDIRITNDDGISTGFSSIMMSPDEENYENSLEEELETLDLFGYHKNPDCFWQTRHNDLLTTVVQPVYDRKNESVITEKYLLKNVWTTNEVVMRTAQLLGVAAADMKINDIIALAPSHKLGTNGYAIMLTNNGFAMHHPDLRSILEPFSSDESDKNMRILKPSFSSLDFTQVEHILNHTQSDRRLVNLRKEAVSGKTGWDELLTKRTLDCQKRIQSRRQSFYYKPIQQFPFSFMIAIPQPYGSHRLEAQIEIKSSSLPEKLTTYFTTSDYDLWTVHPDYHYCDGPSNNTITTLLDMFQRVEARKLDDIQWRPAESSKPPLFLPGKIVCDKDLVQSLVFDALATFGFSDNCGTPSPSAESSLLGMFGVRFSFVATRSGLTRVRHYDLDDMIVKKEALAFTKKYARAVDETYYERTVDYNMLINDTATLIQVPFNTYEKIRERLNRYEMNQVLNMDSSSSSSSSSFASDLNQLNNLPNPDQDGSIVTDPDPQSSGSISRLAVKEMNVMERLEVLANSSLHVIASQSIIVNDGSSQRAVAGVTGVFYDYASFVIRFFNSTNQKFEDGTKPNTKSATCFTGNSANCDESIKCGLSNDTIDCLLVDNNGFIVVSEDLDYIGRNLRAYDSVIMSRLVDANVFHEINITDYQAVCIRHEEKQSTSSAYRSLYHNLFLPTNRNSNGMFGMFAKNIISVLTYAWTIMATLSQQVALAWQPQQTLPVNSKQPLNIQPMQSLLPNKTYLRPCEKRLTLYETRPGNQRMSSEIPEFYTTRCGCNAWFVYEQVPRTNLIMLIVDTDQNCRHGCDLAAEQDLLVETKWADRSGEDQVCSMFEREAQLYRKKLDSCFSHHSDEQHIKLCGSAGRSSPISLSLLIALIFISITTTLRLHSEGAV